MLISKTATIKWHNNNKKWYENKGYKFTGYKNEFEVNTEDLTESSNCIVKVQCDSCLEIMEITFNNYKRSIKHNNKSYCFVCGKIMGANKRKYNIAMVQNYLTTNGLKCKLVSTKYISSKQNLEFKCECGTNYKATWNDFYLKKIYQCRQCGIGKRTDANTKTSELFISEVFNLTGNDYTVLGEYKSALTKILMRHNKCGCEWETKPNVFLSGRRCPKCKESRGEKKVCHYLEKMKIKYLTQKVFKDCKDKRALPFDFYLPDNNTLIEFDGRQHYQTLKYREDKYSNLLYQQKHDKIKNDYCVDSNIMLIRIPYWEINNVEKILDDILINKNKFIERS